MSSARCVEWDIKLRPIYRSVWWMVDHADPDVSIYCSGVCWTQRDWSISCWCCCLRDARRYPSPVLCQSAVHPVTWPACEGWTVPANDHTGNWSTASVAKTQTPWLMLSTMAVSQESAACITSCPYFVYLCILCIFRSSLWLLYCYKCVYWICCELSWQKCEIFVLAHRRVKHPIRTAWAIYTVQTENKNPYDVVTCEITVFRNNLEIISVCYFTSNHSRWLRVK